MPVRQTDDYLTARAANPRTGLISPSAAGTPYTLPDHRPQMSRDSSAASQVHTIPRKLCGVGLKSAQSAMWLHDGSAWHQDTRALKMGSPLLGTTPPRAAATTALDTSYLDNDQFVVKMPSAREPQPYKFPGSSGAQIKAFEHYKHKAKRTSGQGYDHRLIELYEQDDVDLAMPTQRPVLRPVIHPVQDRPQPPPHVTPFSQVFVPKHRSHVVHNDPSPFQRAEPPLSPPRTFSVETAIHHPPAIVPGSPPTRSLSEETTIHHVVTPEARNSPDTKSSVATITTSRAPSHLGQLPRIRLVHPSLAGVPSTPTARKCSLGCSRIGDGNVCINPAARRDTTPTMDTSLRDMLHVHQTAQNKEDSPEAPSLGQFAESVALMFTVLWQVLQSGLTSHEQAFHRLFPQDLTFWEKVLIFKSIVVLLAKAVAMFLIVAVMWKTVDMAIQMVRFLFMPLRFLLGLR